MNVTESQNNVTVVSTGNPGNSSSTNLTTLLTTLVPDIIKLTHGNDSGVEMDHKIENRTLATTTFSPMSAEDFSISTSTFKELNEPDPESIGFVLIPLILIIAVAFISGIGFMLMSKRRRLDRLRHRLIPTYTFSPGEEDEWGNLINSNRD